MYNDDYDHSEWSESPDDVLKEYCPNDSEEEIKVYAIYEPKYHVEIKTKSSTCRK
jgi:hypothetical protein